MRKSCSKNGRIDLLVRDIEFEASQPTARATELVGIVAMSVGRERMEPILPPYIEAAITGFKLEYSELREYSHGFFSNMAEILGDGFAQYLPLVVPLVFSSCNLDDGSAIDIDEPDGDENVSGFGGVSSDDEAHDEPRVRNISVRTGVLDEKAAATQALGQFALHTKSFYAPYFDRNRGSVPGLFCMLMLCFFTFGLEEGPAKAKEVLDTVMNISIKTMTDDDDKEVVAQACIGIAEIVNTFGFAAAEPYMSQLIEAVLVLLKEESACQLVESDGEADEDDAEHDEILMDAVSDLLPAFAKCMGPHFAPVFSKWFGPFMKFSKASRPPQDRTMVVASLAEVAQNMGAPIAGYIETMMPLVLKELASSEATNRRNAAFCVGELCKNGGEATLRYYVDILRGLSPLFSESEPDNAVRDNAAGAVARMIMVHPEAIPLNQVLPVFLKVLPLKEDQEESMAVYSCICGLVLSSNPQMLSLVPDLMSVFAQVVLSPVETDEVKAFISRVFSHLMSLYGQQMQPILTSLPPAHANAFASFVSRT
ncbi:putative importin subunit beta-4 [Drosera capensis]